MLISFRDPIPSFSKLHTEELGIGLGYEAAINTLSAFLDTIVIVIRLFTGYLLVQTLCARRDFKMINGALTDSPVFTLKSLEPSE